MDAAITNISDPGVAINFANVGEAHYGFNAGVFSGVILVHNSSGLSGAVNLLQSYLGVIENANFADDSGANILNLSLSVAVKSLPFNTQGFIAVRNTGSARGSFVATGADAARTGYIALKAGTGTTAKFAWLRARVQNTAAGIPGVFSFVAKAGDPTVFGAWILDSDPGADNFATGDVAAVPEPSTVALGGLGLLALGAAGMSEMRKRRKLQTVAAE
ncbi:MAG: PEP-CTERM sorting domain-containing protein [Chthoniobacterales bacterium]